MKPGALAPASPAAMRKLYDQDFLQWTIRNAELLRSGRLSEADIEHIAEEIEDLGKNQQRELGSRLRVLITHLLKLRVEPASRGVQGWKATVRVQRSELRRLLRQAPSLASEIPVEVGEVYSDAVARAAAGTRRPDSSFPESCPFTPDQILDVEFFAE